MTRRAYPSLAAALVTVAVSAASSLFSNSAHAQAHREVREVSEPPPLPTSMWHQEWPTFSPWEGVATVAAGLGTGALLLVEPPREARWQGAIWFDDGLRGGLRLHSESARRRARSLGDLPYFAAPLLPMIVDPLIVAWLVRGDGKTALNLELMSLEAFSYSGLSSFISTRISRRERPDSGECRRLHPDDDGTCAVDTEAFFSGHTAIAATSAGLVCANHARLPLWGHPVADASACALSTTAAAATGVSRILADRHYATDVLAGFGFGFAIGYAVPVLLHYSRAKTDVALSIEPGAPCTGGCLRLSGSF